MGSPHLSTSLWQCFPWFETEVAGAGCKHSQHPAPKLRKARVFKIEDLDHQGYGIIITIFLCIPSNHEPCYGQYSLDLDFQKDHQFSCQHLLASEETGQAVAPQQRSISVTFSCNHIKNNSGIHPYSVLNLTFNLIECKFLHWESKASDMTRQNNPK